MSEQQKELAKVRFQLGNARVELTSSRHVLSDVTNKLQTTLKQRDCARKQALKHQQKLEAVITDSP